MHDSACCFQRLTVVETLSLGPQPIPPHPLTGCTILVSRVLMPWPYNNCTSTQTGQCQLLRRVLVNSLAPQTLQKLLNLYLTGERINTWKIQVLLVFQKFYSTSFFFSIRSGAYYRIFFFTAESDCHNKGFRCFYWSRTEDWWILRCLAPGKCGYF